MATPPDHLEEASLAEIREAVAGIVGRLRTFLRGLIRKDEAFLRETLRGRAPLDVVDEAIALEVERARQFAENTETRVDTQLPIAMALPDPDARRMAIQSIMAREKRWAGMRSEAMTARAVATADRAQLKIDSPQGAYWELDPNVREHTAGCLIMGGKFWPWQVLDLVHPPRHYGCPCRLRGFGDVIANGVIGPGDVPSLAQAVRMAAGVVMEAEAITAFAALIETVELREEMVERGMVTQEWVDVHLPV